MWNLSIVSLDEAHVEKAGADIIKQQRTGASTCAMFMMKLNPDGTPPVDRAKRLCKRPGFLGLPFAQSFIYLNI